MRKMLCWNNTFLRHLIYNNVLWKLKYITYKNNFKQLPLKNLSKNGCCFWLDCVFAVGCLSISFIGSGVFILGWLSISVVASCVFLGDFFLNFGFLVLLFIDTYFSLIWVLYIWKNKNCKVQFVIGCDKHIYNLTYTEVVLL